MEFAVFEGWSPGLGLSVSLYYLTAESTFEKRSALLFALHQNTSTLLSSRLILHVLLIQ